MRVFELAEPLFSVFSTKNLNFNEANNNAIKFLMAQYRAIFKNAYFKGLTSAVLLTAGMAAAGSAQAAALNDFTKLTNADEEYTITGNGSDDGSTDNKYGNLVLNVSQNQTLNSTITITGGTPKTGNVIYGSGAAAVSLSGNGQLIIDTDDTTKGLNIDSRVNTNKFDVSLKNVAVNSGVLNVLDKVDSTSGAISLSADTISVGGAGIAEATGATAILKIASEANQASWKGVTLGRAGVENATDSVITVDDGGVVLMSATNASKDATSIVGQSLTVNAGGLIVTSGSGSNTIASRMTQVDGGLMVSGATSVTSHETVVNGNLLVSGGTLTVNAAADYFDKANTSFKAPGTFTIGAGANVQIHDAVRVEGGTLVVTNDANLVATEAASGNSSGSIIVDAGDDSSHSKSAFDFVENGATLQISSAELKDFLTAATENDYTGLTFDPAKNTLTPTAEEFDSKSKAGAVLLLSGGRLHLSDTDFVDLTTNFNFSGGTGNPIAGAIAVSGAGVGFLTADKLAVSDKLRTDATDKDTAVANAINLHIGANELSLGNDNYSGDTLGFRRADVQDTLTVNGKDGLFKNGDELHFNRDFYQQVPVDVNTTLDTVNGFVENGTGSIVGDDIELVNGAGAGAANTSGSLAFDGGRWNTAVDIRGLPLINSPKWCRRLKAVNR